MENESDTRYRQPAFVAAGVIAALTGANCGQCFNKHRNKGKPDMHYYRFFINDYRSATSHLSNEEDLAYRRLLDMYYDTESPIPTETEWVSRRLRLGCQVVSAVLADFFVLEADGWHHPVCDAVIADYHAMKETNQVNGRRGGRPRKNRPETESVTNGNPVETDLQPTQNRSERQSLIINQEDNIVPTELVDLPSTTRADPIPYKSIIEAYNEICVPLGKPAARRNNPKRQARIRQIWNESSRTRTVDWWRDYFAKAMTVPYIAKGFITRDGSLWNGADLDYLLQDKTLTKIVEGTYDNAQR